MGQSHQLTVVFKGMDSDRGVLLVRVTNEKGEEIGGHEVLLKEKKGVLTLQLPEGKYAIAVFHDENGNGKLDTNFFGLPVEKYGFSNNARGTFGPPPLEEQWVALEKDTSISITLK